MRTRKEMKIQREGFVSNGLINDRNTPWPRKVITNCPEERYMAEFGGFAQLDATIVASADIT